jgi:phosphate uptake regulator
METRKVQRTGKSTFIVSIPKSWAKKNGIEAGSLIYIHQSENGALMMTTDPADRDWRVRLDIKDRSGDPLIRDLIGCYLAGYRTIEVVSDRMTSDQKKEIHDVVNMLIGPEILEETISKVMIQDLLSSEELQAERALRRIKTVVKSMIQDSIEALVKRNRDLAIDVMERDKDVDRLNLLVSRQFTEILRSGSVRQEIPDAITAFNYSSAASNLERIADHARTIAYVAARYEQELPKGLDAELAVVSATFNELIDESISSLTRKNSEQANKIIERIHDLLQNLNMMVDPGQVSDRKELMVRIVVSSSIERMLDYIKNIGELAINLSHIQVESR